MLKALKSFSLQNLWLPVDGVGFLSRRVVFLVHFDGFVRLSCDHAALGVIKHAGEDPRLAVQRAGLHGRVDPLEIIPRPPVPHVDRTVIGSRNQNSIRVHCERVNDGVVSRQILDEVPVWKFPLLDVVWRSRGECVLSRM